MTDDYMMRKRQADSEVDADPSLRRCHRSDQDRPD